MLASCLSKAAAKLRADQRGTSLIEFAIAAPIFIMMLIALGDTARGFTEKYSLQQAVNRTLELAQLGSPDDDYEFLRTKAAEAATDAGIRNATVTLTSWLECDGTQKAWGESCSSGQQIARYLTIRISSRFEPIFGGSVYPGALPDGSVPIAARASVRVQ